MGSRSSRDVALLLALAASVASCRPARGDAAVAESATKREPIASAPSATERPRLVLWITVDQLRGDFLDEFARHVTRDGFGRLLEGGAYYANAYYAHGLTETAPGHATLFTGAFPKDHGIVGNSWLDRDAKLEVVSVFDPAAPLIGSRPAEPAVSDATDPSSAEQASGRSPRNLRLPTLGDTLRLATAKEAKVFSVSTKDRAAILPGGALGKAFWLGPEGYVTSRYYDERLPAWAEAQNAEIPSYRGARWTLLHPRSKYRRADADDRPSERPPHGLGRTFPHPLPTESTNLGRTLSATPFADELTVSFALRILQEEALGADDVPDLLAVSLSATDAVGHAFGPESLEAEDNFARLDRQLARLLSEVDARVGLERTLVVLSADHGACETAEFAAELGLPAGRIEPEELTSWARQLLQQRYGDADLLLGFTNPTLWLDRARVRERGLDELEVARALALALAGRDDVQTAWAVHDLLAEEAGDPSLTDPPLRARARRSLHPERSGDVYVVPRPHVLLLQDPSIAATHGSPWTYDSHVPVLLKGPGVRPGVYARPVGPHQLAATVARLLRIPPPAGATRAILHEIFDDGAATD